MNLTDSVSMNEPHPSNPPLSPKSVDSGIESAGRGDEPVGLSRVHVERSYRRYAPIYDFLFGASLGQGRDAMAKLVSSLAPTNILEVGVGTGLTLRRYPTTARVTGIDVSQEMLAVARGRVKSGDEDRILLDVMDAEAMAFPDNHFDCVTLPYVLSVTPDPDRLVAEVRRVCKPGGHIVVVNHFSGQSSWRPLEALARPLAKWLGFRSEFSLEQHVTRHSWEVVSVVPTNMFALSRLIHIRNV
jgi:phosphatidylethanolamine/phosphatidyl-N-methylethanolamine N-methyltransferase